MAKRQTNLVRNPPTDKHRYNRQAKHRSLAGLSVCVSCGETYCHCNDRKIPPSDPDYLRVVLRKKGETKSSRWAKKKGRGKKAPRAVVKNNNKLEPLVIPDFLAEISQRMSLQSRIPLECLGYCGRSKRLGAKAGRKKIMGSHCFVVKDPIIHPVHPHGEVKHLWHGSPLKNTEGILAVGLRSSYGGMLGPGVYLGNSRKAQNYAHKGHSSWGLMLYCRVDLGRVVLPSDDHKPHDSIYCRRGRVKKAWSGFVRNDEWCIRDPARVTILEIHLVPNPRFKTCR